MMPLNTLFRIKCVLLIHMVLITPVYSADCDPKPDANVVTSLVANRDSNALVDHLVSSAGLSTEFVSSHGNAGVRDSIQTLVRKYFDSRNASSEPLNASDAMALIAKFREGILASCEAIKNGESDKTAARKAVKAAALSGGDSDFVVLLGSSNSLEGDGNFSSGLEASFLSTTEFTASNLPLIGKFYGDESERKITGFFEITFSEIGSIDEAEMPEAPSSSTNPFESGGGFFRLNTGADFYLSAQDASGLGIRVGGGFSTQPASSSDDDVDTRGRGYVGLVFRANYGKDDRGKDGRGEVFLGIAKDKFWKYDRVVDDTTVPVTTAQINETNRLVVDARMDIPQVFESEDVRLHARLFADLPASGNGPSDIRISLLLTVNLGAFFPLN